jgi:hypothetical protein
MPSAATGGTFSAANYAITYTNGALTVSPAPLTVSSGISANNKVYDGTPGATITSNNVALPGVLAGDTVNLTTNGYIANFTSAGAGNGIAVTVTGLKLAGASAANYVFTQPTALKANITSKPLTMSGLSVPLSKVYDGTTTAVVGNSPGLLQATEAPGAGSSSDGKPYAGDAVSLTGTATGAYNNKDVATASTVTFGGLSLSGAQAGDYTLTIQGAASAAITAKTLSLSGLAVPSSKVYDGTTTAVVSGSPGMLQAAEAAGAGSNSDGKPYTGDGVSLAGTATGTYNSKDVATAATVTFGGLSLNGVQAGDYSLTIQVASPATISPKGLSVTSGITANNKYFDNTTAATLSFNSVVLQGIVTGDIVTVNPVGYTANFGGAGVGSGIAVTVAGLSLSGAAAADYSLTQPTGLTASITVPSLQILSALPNIVLSWPTNAGAFVLNTAPSLASASAWTAVTGGIVASGTNNTFTTNASNGDGFYKLIAP